MHPKLVTASEAWQSIFVFQEFFSGAGLARHDGLPRYARNDDFASLLTQ